MEGEVVHRNSCSNKRAELLFIGLPQFKSKLETKVKLRLGSALRLESGPRAGTEIKLKAEALSKPIAKLKLKSRVGPGWQPALTRHRDGLK
ncbi:hypothetical protein EVAR_7559_1 [Eumeta japonica]|uniref:Uncharacterized protein n=1 Tax=Eumeta variegata TaxID=151549 RepID=A0A4C1VPU5_EUMVA|nr:hypothetical protein EVAR_7559_1 [Eumeta japonica]